VGIIHPQAVFLMRIMAVAWVHTTHVMHIYSGRGQVRVRLIKFLFKGTVSLATVAVLNLQTHVSQYVRGSVK
jgi:hypothetical protein